MNITEAFPFLIYQGGVKYKFLWDDKNFKSDNEMSVWRPSPPRGYANVGDVFVGNSRKEPDTNTKILFILDDTKYVTKPLDYELVWNNYGATHNNISIWRPIPPENYVALGYVSGEAKVDDELYKPNLDTMRCVHKSYVKIYQQPARKIWQSDGADAEIKLSAWSNNEFHTFYAVGEQLAFTTCPTSTKYTIKQETILKEPPIRQIEIMPTWLYVVLFVISFIICILFMVLLFT